MTRWKVKLSGTPEDDAIVELYAAHWRQKENCVEDMLNLEQDRQVLSTADEDLDEQESGEDWGDEVEAYSRRGGLGVRCIFKFQ